MNCVADQRSLDRTAVRAAFERAENGRTGAVERYNQITR